MRILTRLWAAAVAVLALGIGGWWSGTSKADDEKDTWAAVLKIADALQKGEFVQAKNQAAALAKTIEDVHYVMGKLGERTRKRGRIGVGPVPDDGVPDNIHDYVSAHGGYAPSQNALNKQAAALERAAYVAAAVLEVTLAKPQENFDGLKAIKLWKSSAAAARDGLLELAKAAASKSPAAVRAAAGKTNTSCINCHSLVLDRAG